MNTTKAHPFELAGLGRGPYKFCGVAEIPTCDASALGGVEAYNQGLAELPKLVNGRGTCGHCGLAIRYICIVEDADGNRYGVGSDCVEKTDDPCLGNKGKVAVAKITARKRAEKAEIKRAAAQAARWEADRPAREAREAAAATIQLERDTKVAALLANVDPYVLERLAEVAKDDGFFESLNSQLRFSGSLSWRQAESVAKLVFGRQTKKNTVGFEAVIESLTTK